jgi:hypothetical protein
MADKPFFIADGHHATIRVNYHQRAKQKVPLQGRTVNYVAMYLVRLKTRDSLSSGAPCAFQPDRLQSKR